MSIKIKAGTNFILPVKIECSNFSDISAIEFLFKQSKNGGTLKTAYWSSSGTNRDAQKKSDENTILVFFSNSDTYLFRQNEPFFMDVRIHYSDSVINPFTKIITLIMRETLFSDGEEVNS